MARPLRIDVKGGINEMDVMARSARQHGDGAPWLQEAEFQAMRPPSLEFGATVALVRHLNDEREQRL
jgi:hypothetical protein